MQEPADTSPKSLQRNIPEQPLVKIANQNHKENMKNNRYAVIGLWLCLTQETNHVVLKIGQSEFLYILNHNKVKNFHKTGRVYCI